MRTLQNILAELSVMCPASSSITAVIEETAWTDGPLGWELRTILLDLRIVREHDDAVFQARVSAPDDCASYPDEVIVISRWMAEHSSIISGTIGRGHRAPIGLLYIVSRALDDADEFGSEFLYQHGPDSAVAASRAFARQM